MKKYLLSLILTLFVFEYSFSQIFNQDAQGKSSIIGLGGTINLDLNESLFKANYYKTSRTAKTLLFGFDVQGKNNEGTVGLFEGGEFSPSGEATGLIGAKYGWKGSKQMKDSEDMRTYNFYFYGRVGVKGSELKYDKGNTFTSTNTRFVDTTHITPKIEFGTSFRFRGSLLLGALIGYSKENNQGSLTKSVYKYVINDPTLPGLQQTKDITAYSGEYGVFSNTYLYFDALYLIPVENVYVIPGVYFRNNNSNKETFQKDNSVLGASLNFVNLESGKFFGGVYVQSNDIFDDNIQPSSLYRKIQFGLVARISFTTIRTDIRDDE